MARKTTYTFSDGRIAKRTSERATYNFVIIGRLDLDKLREEAKASARSREYRWDEAAEVAAMAAGTTDSWGVLLRQETIDSCKAFITTHPKESYVTAHLNARLAEINEMGLGAAGDLEIVLQWSSNYETALKATSKYKRHYSNVTVKPVDRKEVAA